MPSLRDDPVLAVCCSDLHISLKPPLARAEEPDWGRAMGRVIGKIKSLALKYGTVLCAGDVFDKWNAPPETINWALEHLPQMFAIPGNHDLPNHNPELLHKSAYWTLVRAGKIVNVGPDPMPMFTLTANRAIEWWLVGFPFKGEPNKSEKTQHGLRVAMVHDYLWTHGHGYTCAPLEARLDKVAKRFHAFDVVVVGDNHMGFKRRLKGATRVLNCGTPIRRKSSEVDYTPRVWLLHESGRIRPVKLSTRKDVITKLVTEQQEDYDEQVGDFVDSLAGLDATGLDYRDAVIRAMRKFSVPKEVETEIMEAMG